MKPDKTIERLKKWKGEFSRIAKESGMSYSTLTKLATGKLPNPRKGTLDKINGWLSRNRTG